MKDSLVEHGGTFLLDVFPHLSDRGVTKDTKLWVYREYKPMRDEIEYTLIFRPEGEAKWIIDATATIEDLTRVGDNPEIPEEYLVASVWKITYMGPAITYLFSEEDADALTDIRKKRLESLLSF